MAVKIFNIVLKARKGVRLFIDEEDRLQYWIKLNESMKKMKSKLVAGALMSNHIHLLIGIEESILTNFLKSINVKWTRFLIKEGRITGTHVFDKNKIFQEKLNVGNYSRIRNKIVYINRNPFKEKIVDDIATNLASSIPLVITALSKDNKEKDQDNIFLKYKDFAETADMIDVIMIKKIFSNTNEICIKKLKDDVLKVDKEDDARNYLSKLLSQLGYLRYYKNDRDKIANLKSEDKKRIAIILMRKFDIEINDIAELLGVSKKTIYRYWSQM